MDYKLLFDTAVFAGEVLMKNGAETYRVEDTMYRILKKSNLKTVQVLVLMTGFVATLDDPSIDSLTVVRRINSRGTNLDKVNRVNNISREFCEDRITLEEAFRQMKKLWKEPDSTKKNLAWRVECEFGATQGKTDLAKLAKKYNLDAIHDTVHEMARDEARHGKALKGLLDRYFK